MKTLLIISIIPLVISLLVNFIQKERVEHLVDDNENLQDTISSLRTNAEVIEKNLKQDLEKSNNALNDFRYRFNSSLELLKMFNSTWRKRLTFYNPEECKPTLLLKFNNETETYEFFRIGKTDPLDITAKFVHGNQTLDQVIEKIENYNS